MLLENAESCVMHNSLFCVMLNSFLPERGTRQGDKFSAYLHSHVGNTANCDRRQQRLKLQLHDVIYRLRFYSNSLTHILSLSNSHNNVASLQKNQGDKSHRVIVALKNVMIDKREVELIHTRMIVYLPQYPSGHF